jgi:Resolvase, N terminal domain
MVTLQCIRRVSGLYNSYYIIVVLSIKQAEPAPDRTRAGWEVIEVYEDAGIPGAKDRDKRPSFDRLLKDATSRRFDVLMAWLIDRLCRSLQYLVLTLADLEAAEFERGMRPPHRGAKRGWHPPPLTRAAGVEGPRSQH